MTPFISLYYTLYTADGVISNWKQHNTEITDTTSSFDNK